MRPSEMKRLALCPGSAAVCEYVLRKYGELREEGATATGTACHDVMRFALNYATRDADGPRPFMLPLVDATAAAERYIERWHPSLSQWDRRCIARAMIWFWERVEEWGVSPADIDVEVHLRGQETLGLDPEHGTADVVITIPGRCIVIDWKFGYREQDHAEDHDQLATYAAMAWWTYGLAPVDVWAVQPRIGTMDTGCRFSEAQLASTSEWVLSVTARAKTPHAQINPSWSACEYCDGIVVCKAAWRYIVEAKAMLADLEAEPDDQSLSHIIAAAKMGAALERKVTPLARRLMRAGCEPEGWALKSGAEDARIIDKAGAALAAQERGIIGEYAACANPSLPELRERLGDAVVDEVFGPFIETKQKEPSIVARKGDK